MPRLLVLMGLVWLHFCDVQALLLLLANKNKTNRQLVAIPLSLSPLYRPSHCSNGRSRPQKGLFFLPQGGTLVFLYGQSAQKVTPAPQNILSFRPLLTLSSKYAPLALALSPQNTAVPLLAAAPSRYTAPKNAPTTIDRP